jgi:hypothetical protein
MPQCPACFMKGSGQLPAWSWLGEPARRSRMSPLVPHSVDTRWSANRGSRARTRASRSGHEDLIRQSDYVEVANDHLAACRPFAPRRTRAPQRLEPWARDGGVELDRRFHVSGYNDYGARRPRASCQMHEDGRCSGALRAKRVITNASQLAIASRTHAALPRSDRKRPRSSCRLPSNAGCDSHPWIACRTVAPSILCRLRAR